MAYYEAIFTKMQRWPQDFPKTSAAGYLDQDAHFHKHFVDFGAKR